MPETSVEYARGWVKLLQKCFAEAWARWCLFSFMSLGETVANDYHIRFGDRAGCGVLSGCV